VVFEWVVGRQRGVGNKLANRSEKFLHKGNHRQRGVGNKLANWGEIISYIIAIGWANDRDKLAKGDRVITFIMSMV